MRRIPGYLLWLARGGPADEGLSLVLGSAPADVSPGLWAEVRDVLESRA